MARDTRITNMAIKFKFVQALSAMLTRVYRKTNRPVYERRRHLRGERIASVIHLNVVNEPFFHSTAFVDQHITTRQPNAPEHEIKDWHRVVVFGDGSYAGR